MAPSPRYTTLLLVTILLSFSHAAKEVASLRSQALQGHHGEVEEETMGFTAEDEMRCGGAGGEGEEEDCLMRRTLVAHTDYIYTQGKHN